MPLEAKGKFGKAKKGATGAIWVPAALVRDSQFPLKEGRVLIKIEKDTLIVKQARRRLRLAYAEDFGPIH